MVRQDKCAVSSCLAVRDPTKSISLHKLPQDEDSFAFWAEFLRKANGVAPSGTRKHLVCSQHFQSSCIGNGPMNKKFILAGHTPSLLNAKELTVCSKCSPYELSEKFVGTSVSTQLKCGECITLMVPTNLELMKARPDFTLINQKDNGGLFYPSGLLIKICRIAERVITLLKQSGLQNLDSKVITARTMKECHDGGLLGLLLHDNTDEHDCQDKMDHCLELVRLISARYTKTRLNFISKEATLKLAPTTVRNTCTKLVQFKGN